MNRGQTTQEVGESPTMKQSLEFERKEFSSLQAYMKVLPDVYFRALRTVEWGGEQRGE